MRSLLALGLAAATLTAGCASEAYRISGAELQRIARLPPEQRAQRVRVDQSLNDSDAPPAERVGDTTEIIFVPNVDVGGSIRYDHPVAAGGAHGGGGASSLGQAANNKDAAIAIVVIAAVALFAVAAVEGSRWDGEVAMHPMHPVHLFGRDGGYTVVPVAWIDPQLAAWADHGIVRSYEGPPWKELHRAPLWREGATYGMYGGYCSYASALGDKAFGPAFLIQGGFYPTNDFGILASVFLGWRQNQQDNTLFETRPMLEAHYLPVAAGPLHLGLFGGGGFAYRYEDGVVDGNSTSLALTGGALLELELHTRVSLTARLGTTRAHDEQMADAMIGLAVY